MIGYDSFDYASVTDVGVKRSHNQDAHATLLAGDAEQWRARGHIFLVADGMGAHAVGEMASEMAVRSIPHTYHKHAPQDGVTALRKAFVEANATIHSKGQQNPEFGGMGTTTTALLIRPEGAWVGHVGDSRAYRIRDGQIEQLTFDHSLVWEMARRQKVAPEGLEGFPTNVIVRSLGPEPLVQVDLEGPHPIKPGDIYLLCSDGLSGQLSDAEIGALASALPPAEACRLLVDLANLRGGPDNITVLIVRINAPAPQEVTPIERAPWYKMVPWPVKSLFFGVLLAGFAFYLHDKVAVLALTSFVLVLAAIAIGAGIVGLVIHHREERRRAAQPRFLPPHIYRQAACPIDRALVEKVALAAATLESQIKERQWATDWDGYYYFRESAQKLLAEDRFADALRDHCHAIRFLVEAFQRQRPKGEAFQPVW